MILFFKYLVSYSLARTNDACTYEPSLLVLKNQNTDLFSFFGNNNFYLLILKYIIFFQWLSNNILDLLCLYLWVSFFVCLIWVQLIPRKFTNNFFLTIRKIQRFVLRFKIVVAFGRYTKHSTFFLNVSELVW